MFRVETNLLIKESGFSGSKYEVSASTPEALAITKTDYQLFSNKYKMLQNYCKDDKDFIVEIYARENWHILEIIDCAFHRIFDYLEKNQKSNYSLRLYLSQDIEIPQWKQFIIEIKSGLHGFDSREELWDKLIDVFDKSYIEYIQRASIVETEIEKDAYRRISIALN